MPNLEAAVFLRLSDRPPIISTDKSQENMPSVQTHLAHYYYYGNSPVLHPPLIREILANHQKLQSQSKEYSSGEITFGDVSLLSLSGSTFENEDTEKYRKILSVSLFIEV
nr:unnamed protein product [Callosobruchus analis]